MYVSMFVVIYVSMQGCYVAVCNSVKLESQFGISNYGANIAEFRLRLSVRICINVALVCRRF